MKSTRVVKAAVLALSISGTIAFVSIYLASTKAHAQNSPESEQSQIVIGWRIAPPFINAQGKNPALVGLGSFIVNGRRIAMAVTDQIPQMSTWRQTTRTFSRPRTAVREDTTRQPT